MISREELLNEWDVDSKIDKSKVMDYLAELPSLHAKYTRHLSDHRMALIKYSTMLASLKKEKLDYYSGRYSQEQLKEHNLKPFRLTLKGDINAYIEADPEYQKLFLKKCYHEEMFKLCELYVKDIANRSFELREYLQHERWLSGAK